ncbi:MAG: DUF4836 family protein, partial [Bacteroidota bacterium]
MKRLTLITLALILSFGIVQAQDLLRYIPKDATVVMGINPNRIKSKIDMEKVKKMDFYTFFMDQMAKEIPDGPEADMAMDFISAPEKYGLGVYDDSYFFLKMNDDESMYINFLFSMTNKDAFEGFLEGEIFARENLQIKQMAGFSAVEVDDMNLAWNDKVILMTTAEDLPNFEGEDMKDFKGHKQALIADRAAAVLGTQQANSNVAVVKPKEHIAIGKATGFGVSRIGYNRVGLLCAKHRSSTIG